MKQIDAGANSACWFVGAVWNGTDDQSKRFIAEGIWENGYTDRYLDLVKSMHEGERIAIKATYTVKNGLDFDARGNRVSVMEIKATGLITKNPGDGRRIEVAWKPVASPRRWCFYTYQKAVWKVLPGSSWHADALIAFAFEGRDQDLHRFRNDPYWRERFGDTDEHDRKFAWTAFYEAIADGLLAYKDRRPELVRRVNELAGQNEYCSYLHDQDGAGNNVPLDDICPFTVMGLFNRGTTDENRKALASEIASLLEVDVPVPSSFEGIPVLNNQKSMFFSFSKDRQPGDIDALWTVFSRALAFAESLDAESRNAFAEAYADAIRVFGVGWNLSIGLYWARPWAFPTLDRQSRIYLAQKLKVVIGHNGPKHYCGDEDYLAVIDTLSSRFGDEGYPAHSFPGLSLAAWQYEPAEPLAASTLAEADGTGEDDMEEEAPVDFGRKPSEPYAIGDIIAEGSFLDRARLETILRDLRHKRNIILQGPPGTGKSWLAKRLGYALIGARDESRLRSVQFHPNMSYEDFVRGYRPNGQGRLDLVDGPFLRIVSAALADTSSDSCHVLVIEEINRGNPAQIFGEMLTLMEDSKRGPKSALELCYPRYMGEQVHVPQNLYIIGTMNIADRSLALVDLALRRRFAFLDLEPCFNGAWRSWLKDKVPIDAAFIDDIAKRVADLNYRIETDTSLGRQYRIGHSFFTPHEAGIENATEWYREVIETQVGPLLEEYWYDRLDTAREAKARLLSGL